MGRLNFTHYKQPDEMDCGATCLRMVAKHYGKTYSLSDLRQATQTTREGINLQGLANAAEKIGFRTFKNLGCIACHQGVNIGGNMFQTIGKFGNYIQDRGNATPADLGRFNVTKRERDRYKFKVPSLRNIELTAPYFHDGSKKDLKETVQTMAKYQLGRPISSEEADSIVLFLKTLTGKSEKKSLTAEAL